MKKVSIPSIYEEDIIGFFYDGVKVQIKYNYKETIINLNFNYVYHFDFCEFDYIKDINWEFGLIEYHKSCLLKDFFSGIPSQKISYAFGGEIEKIRHYKLVIDDVGIYNIICKEFFFRERRTLGDKKSINVD